VASRTGNSAFVNNQDDDDDWETDPDYINDEKESFSN